MPRDSFTHTSVASAPIGDVWAALDRPETWEAVGGVDRVLDPVINGDGHLRGFSFEVVAAGRRYHGKATPHRRENHRVMAWKVDTPEVRGTTRVELGQVDGGTEISVTLEVESRGTLSTMFFPLIAGTIGRGLPRSVDAFAAELSSPS